MCKCELRAPTTVFLLFNTQNEFDTIVDQSLRDEFGLKVVTFGHGATFSLALHAQCDPN